MNRLRFVPLIVLLTLTAIAQERHVRPVDEAHLDPSFKAFRTKLIAAAERRDAAYVVNILAPDIRLSFGGDQGIADFKRMWKPGSRSSRFWDEFLPVIKNGGSFLREKGRRTNLFFAPYSFDSFPDDLDAFEHHVIFGSDVNLRREPGVGAPVVARLSYNVVRVELETLPKSRRSDHPGWVRVRTLGGLEGYVKKEFVRSPIDYRAGFEKVRGRWRMIIFVAGD